VRDDVGHGASLPAIAASARRAAHTCLEARRPRHGRARGRSVMRSPRRRCAALRGSSAILLVSGLVACAPPAQLGGVAIAPGLYERLLLASRFGHDELEARADAPAVDATALPPSEPPTARLEPDAALHATATSAPDPGPRAPDVPPSLEGCMPPANDDPRAHGDGDRGGRAGPR
jgi:hypothetical protein